MSRLSDVFKNKPIFMPYFPVGYPNIKTSIDVLEALAKNGADLIEVGLSFSDPLADGPVIQKATQIALEKGVTTGQVIEAVAELRKRGVTIPLLLMGYYNPILAYGLEKFVHDAGEAGADGFIIPDLPPEEAGEFKQALNGGLSRAKPVSKPADVGLPNLDTPGDQRLPLITMLAPTTPGERMETIARNAQGFIYLVSVTGTTGERKDIATDLADLVARVREHTSVPVCVGFGIGTPEQAKTVGALADGVIVGTACVRAIGESHHPVETAKQFAGSFRKALKGEK
jgi:tryptophan synthase alpha subunit